MAAYHASPLVMPGQWVRVSGPNPVGFIRFQNIGGALAYLQATTGDTPPPAPTDASSSFPGAISVPAGGGSYVSLPFAFPGVPGATVLWAYAPFGQTRLSVSHG